jgi:hypothetical protein
VGTYLWVRDNGWKRPLTPDTAVARRRKFTPEDGPASD